MSNVQRVLSEAMKLSPSEREELAELLVARECLPEDDVSAEECEQAWRLELSERLAAADRGEFAEGDWRDVIERVRTSAALSRQTPTRA